MSAQERSRVTVVQFMCLVWWGALGCVQSSSDTDWSNTESRRKVPPMGDHQQYTDKSGEVDLQLSLSVPATAVLGEPCLVKATLTNTGSKRVICTPRSDGRDVGIKMFDAKNHELPKTAFGERVLRPELKPEDVDISSALWEPLEPGESRGWQRDLAKCFDLSPGEYTVSAAVEVIVEDTPNPRTITTTSKSSRIEIKGPAM